MRSNINEYLFFYQNEVRFNFKKHFSYSGWKKGQWGIKLWNQGLVNLDFDDNETRFRTNDHISSVIRQDNFQSGNHKDKSSQGEIMKKKITSKRRVFQDQSFIRFLCKVVGALGLPCISIFIYAPKSSKSNIALNILRIGWFHVFN